MDEDTARTSNTRIAQKKRAIPHSMKTNGNTKECVVITLVTGRRVPANQPEAFASDLGDDQSRYLLQIDRY